MFGKLLKHEIKTTIREFLIIFAVAIGSAFLLGISIRMNSAVLVAISSIVYSFSMVGLVIMSIYYLFRISGNNAYGKQGYLAFALSVKTHELVLSKIIVNIIYFAMIYLSIILSVFILFLILTPELFANIFATIFDIPFGFLMIGLFWSFVSLVSFICLIQLVFAFSNSCYVHKKTGAKPILFIILASCAISVISEIIMMIIGYNPVIVLDTNYNIIVTLISREDMLIYASRTAMFSIIDLIIDVIVGIVSYILTLKLINKKLELQ